MPYPYGIYFWYPMCIFWCIIHCTGQTWSWIKTRHWIRPEAGLASTLSSRKNWSYTSPLDFTLPCAKLSTGCIDITLPQDTAEQHICVWNIPVISEWGSLLRRTCVCARGPPDKAGARDWAIWPASTAGFFPPQSFAHLLLLWMKLFLYDKRLFHTFAKKSDALMK